VYGLPKNTKSLAPTKLHALNNTDLLIKGKTVILAPHAKSVVQPPLSFWERIASTWLNRGYLVYTSINEGEQPISGTNPLTLPLSEMVSAAEYAGIFIGLRSGLCDVLHTANCRKILVFPDCYYSVTPHKVADFFAMPGWETIIYDSKES
jgi:hypothetical protein